MLRIFSRAPQPFVLSALEERLLRSFILSFSDHAAQLVGS